MPKYVPIDGEQVSRQWHWLLAAIRKAGVNFNVNEGHRTLARQTQLFRNPPVINGRRVLVAFPSPFAPHIRTGRPDHAIDVTNSDAVIKAARAHGVTLTRTVASEPWHLEANARQLKSFASRARRAAAIAKREAKAKRRTPARDRNLSPDGLSFIARWEGFVPHVYNDAAGHATVGFGHLLHHGPATVSDKERYGTKEHPKLSRKEGLVLLRRDARQAQDAVRTLVRVGVSQNEYDALVSFVFNVGAGAFKSSTLLRLLNDGKRGLAGLQFLRWNRAGGRVLLGLSRRRRAERRLFRSR